MSTEKKILEWFKELENESEKFETGTEGHHLTYYDDYPVKSVEDLSILDHDLWCHRVQCWVNGKTIVFEASEYHYLNFHNTFNDHAVYTLEFDRAFGPDVMDEYEYHEVDKDFIKNKLQAFCEREGKSRYEEVWVYSEGLDAVIAKDGYNDAPSAPNPPQYQGENLVTPFREVSLHLPHGATVHTYLPKGFTVKNIKGCYEENVMVLVGEEEVSDSTEILEGESVSIIKQGKTKNGRLASDSLFF